MASNYSKVLFFVLSVLILQSITVHGLPQVPCYFIFGDSLVDSGNNNLLVTKAKANYPPYGIDFVGGPTGRFTNGRTSADIIGQLLGFDGFIPPFATATGSEILKGVNYGSGSSGIRDETGQQLGDRVSFNKQLANHLVTTTRVATVLGSKEAASVHLSKCLYTVNIGSNDYINNYLKPRLYPTSALYTPDQFADVLSKQYSQQLRKLYSLGARKVAVFGVGLIGCTPNEVATRGTVGEKCVNETNANVGLFDAKLQPLVDELNRDLSGANFIYINSVAIALEASAISGASKTGPCCSTREDGQCTSSLTACADRNTYTFWDAFHPTEASNVMIASRAYNATTALDAYPMDIRSLAQL